MFRRSIVMTLLTILSQAGAGSAQDFSGVVIESTPVRGTVHMLKGAGGNLAICAGEDGVVLVDDQFAPLTEKIRAAIEEIDDGAVRFLLNTHWHGDHVGGNENFGKAGTVIVAHDNVHARMSTEQFNETFDRTTPPSPKAALPVVTFNDSATFHVNGETIRAFHVAPAHTDGDAVIHFESANVVHMGDLYFAGMYPYIDVDSGGSVDGLIAAANRVLEVIDEDTKVIPGHGDLSNKVELAAFRDMVVGVRGVIAEAMAGGRTSDEIEASMPTEPWDEVWGGGIEPELFTSIVIRSLEIHGH